MWFKKLSWFRNPTPVIHYATSADAADLAALHKANFANSWSSGDLTSLILDKNIITLVVRNPKICGFLMMRYAAGEAEILTIVIDKKMRSQGLATKLLKEIWGKLALKKIEEVFLEVAENNAPALKLYANLGFKQVGLRKSYYGVNENALILKRHL